MVGICGRPVRPIGAERIDGPDGCLGSLDDLVGAGEERGWNVEAKSFGRFEVDDQLILGRRLHRQVGRLFALEDAIDVAGRAPILAVSGP